MSAFEESQASPVRVFISYSHDSREHCDQVLEFAQQLRRDGIDAKLDQFEEVPAQGWPLWCARQILDVRYVLLICTELYRKRFLGLEEFGKGRGVRWEGKIIQNILYYEEINTGFIPVLFNDSDSRWIPETVREASWYLIPVSIGDSPVYVALIQRLTGGNRFPALGIPACAEAYPRLPRCFVRLGSRPSSQFKSVTSNHLVRFRTSSPRKNLPPSISRKRAEANFLCSFERAFVDGHCHTKQITWRDFALQGYGIPDLITFAWSTQQNQSPALSLEALRQKLQRQQFTAFELKLRDWRKGLVQAYRYRYFCDLSIVVLPSDVARMAKPPLGRPPFSAILSCTAKMSVTSAQSSSLPGKAGRRIGGTCWDRILRR
jgi:hypothetical protein